MTVHMSVRTIFEVERVEVGVDFAPDTFTPQATSATDASVPKRSTATSGRR